MINNKQNTLKHSLIRQGNFHSCVSVVSCMLQCLVWVWKLARGFLRKKMFYTKIVVPCETAAISYSFLQRQKSMRRGAWKCQMGLVPSAPTPSFHGGRTWGWATDPRLGCALLRRAEACSESKATSQQPSPLSLSLPLSLSCLSHMDKSKMSLDRDDCHRSLCLGNCLSFFPQQLSPMKQNKTKGKQTQKKKMKWRKICTCTVLYTCINY